MKGKKRGVEQTEEGVKRGTERWESCLAVKAVG